MAKYITKTFTFEGKRIYVRGKDDIAVALKMDKRKRELEEGRKEISGNMLVSSWTEEWLVTYKKQNVNSRYYKDIQSSIRKYIYPEIGSMPIKKIRPIHLQKILNGMTQFSNSYINKVYDIIRQIFTEAYRNGLIIDNPAESLRRPSGVDVKKRRALTNRERELTLKVAEEHRGGLFVLIMLYCGLRPGEVAALKWCDVDLNNKVIKVRLANKSDDVIGKPKTLSGIRDVPIPDVLVDRMERETRKPFNYVCTDSRGNRLTKSSMRSLWENFKREMNIAAGCRVFRNQLIRPFPVDDDLTLYCYRHTYCTDLQAAGVPINIAKELMGHSNISVTAQIYTHKSEAAFNSAAALINRYVAHDVAPTAENIEIKANSL